MKLNTKQIFSITFVLLVIGQYAIICSEKRAHTSKHSLKFTRKKNLYEYKFKNDDYEEEADAKDQQVVSESAIQSANSEGLLNTMDWDHKRKIQCKNEYGQIYEEKMENFKPIMCYEKEQSYWKNWTHPKCDSSYDEWYKTSSCLECTYGDYNMHCNRVRELENTLNKAIHTNYVNVCLKAFHEKSVHPFCWRSHTETCPVGYVTCGIGACAASPAVCKITIGKQVFNVLKSAYKIFDTITTGGFVSELLEMASKIPTAQLNKKYGDVLTDAILKQFNNIFVKPDLSDRFKREVMVRAARILNDRHDTNNLFRICGQTFDALKESIMAEYNSHRKWSARITQFGNDLKKFNNWNINLTDRKRCQENDSIGCVKQVLGFFEDFDLFGLVTVISAFVHPTCRSMNIYNKKFKFRK